MTLMAAIKIDESVLEQIDAEPQKPKLPVNGMKLSEILDFLYAASDRIIEKSDLYQKTKDESTQIDCIDIVSTKLNDFSQAFMDIIKFIQIKENKRLDKKDGLIKCVNIYKQIDTNQSIIAEEFLNRLAIRNDLTHDYFNYIIHKDNLIALMINYSDGAKEICDFLYIYCQGRGLLQDYVDKDYIRNYNEKYKEQLEEKNEHDDIDL